VIYRIAAKEFNVILDVFAAHVDQLTEEQLEAMAFDPMDIINDLQDEEISGVDVHTKDPA
jgi:hypothetical protein